MLVLIGRDLSNYCGAEDITREGCMLIQIYSLSKMYVCCVTTETTINGLWLVSTCINVQLFSSVIMIIRRSLKIQESLTKNHEMNPMVLSVVSRKYK